MLPNDVVDGSSDLGYESFPLMVEKLRDKVNLIPVRYVYFRVSSVCFLLLSKTNL